MLISTRSTSIYPSALTLSGFLLRVPIQRTVMISMTHNVTQFFNQIAGVPPRQEPQERTETPKHESVGRTATIKVLRFHTFTEL